MYFYEIYISYKSSTSYFNNEKYPSDIDIPVYVLNSPNTD